MIYINSWTRSEVEGLAFTKVLPFQQDSQQFQYCWNKAWVHPYESPWSVFEKFKYANQASTRDLLNIFGADHVRRKVAPLAKRDRDLISFVGFNNSAIEEILGISLMLEQNQFFIEQIAILPNAGETLGDHLHKELTYCPRCMEAGYHSIIHQLTFITSCPFHGCRLVSSCQECSTKIDYLLNDGRDLDAFQCPGCRSYLFKSMGNFSREWKETNKNIVNRTIKRWLSIDNTDKEMIKALIVSKSKMDMSELRKVLDVVERRAISDRYHRVVTSGKWLFKYDNRLEEYLDACRSNDENRILRTVYSTNHAIHHSTDAVVSAVSKYIRNRLIPKHRRCIRSREMRLTCPYAFAYLHWRKSVEYRSSIKFVDSAPLDRGAIHFFHPSFGSIEHRHILYKVLVKWSGSKGQRKYASLAATKWILNRVLGECLIQHFYDWLLCAKQRDPDNREEYEYLPREFAFDPYFIIKVPPYGERQATFEFHRWDHRVNDNSKFNDMLCPLRK